MGNLSTSIRKGINSLLFGYSKEARMLMLGLDAAGKTTIMYQYKLNETIRTIPTIGFNVETMQINNIQVTMWDIGGQNKIRPLWRHYYHGCGALIWVVDTCDTDRFDEVKQELYSVLQEDDLRDISILILANKVDIAKPSDFVNLSSVLNLDSVTNGRKYHIQPCCATSGSGLYEGMEWLCNNL